MILPIIVRRCLFGPGAERPFAPGRALELEASGAAGERSRCHTPWQSVIAARLKRLPRRRIGDRQVAVAAGFRCRLLGLAGLEREMAGEGLLIPRCAAVHTVGMRFELDLVFLDRRGQPLATVHAVPPRRFVWRRGASAVLEIPSRRGGESAAPTA